MLKKSITLLLNSKYHLQRDEGINSTLEWIDIQQSFNIVKGLALQGNSQTTNFSILYDDISSDKLSADIIRLISSKSSEYKGREGVEIYPLELMLYEFVDDGLHTKKAVTLKNGQFKKAKFKVSPMRIYVEKDFLYPCVRGEDISPFHIESNYIVPFAYDSNYSKRVAIEESDLREKSKNLLKHFLNHKQTFEQQNKYSKKIINGKNVPFYSMARVGDYTFAPYHVAYRDNTKNVASVVQTIKCLGVNINHPFFRIMLLLFHKDPMVHLLV